MMEIFIMLAVFEAWFILRANILPEMGIST